MWCDRPMSRRHLWAARQGGAPCNRPTRVGEKLRSCGVIGQCRGVIYGLPIEVVNPATVLRKFLS